MTWTRICRICSCSADYSIYAKIPSYLHSNTNEFLNWQKPINLLIEESTGLKVDKDDGLPENICALCISYLKHAVNFREQTIHNTLNLKSAMLHKEQELENQLIGENEINENDVERQAAEKAALLVTADDLARVPDRGTDITKLFYNYNQPEHNKVIKKLIANEGGNSAAGSNDPQTNSFQKRFSFSSRGHKKPDQQLTQSSTSENGHDVAKAKVFPEDDLNTTTTSGEDSEDTNTMQGKNSFFSYEQRMFEEDDIIDLDVLRSAVKINIPETCKERKCRACFRRFMFEDTYSDHQNTCIELKFLSFVEDINRLLEMRRGKTVSPHEFIRRMIFAIRKVGEWLKQNYIDDILSDIPSNGGGGGGDNSARKPKVVENLNPKLIVDLPPEIAKIPEETHTSTKNILLADEDDSTLDLLKLPKKPLIEPLYSAFESVKARSTSRGTPINMSNNILYEIERCESRQKMLQQLQQQQKEPQPILEDEMVPLNFGQKENVLQKPIPILPPSVIPSSSFLLPKSPAAIAKEQLEQNNLLLKLEKAESLNKSLSGCNEPPKPMTPLICVRKDLQVGDTPAVEVPLQEPQLDVPYSEELEAVSTPYTLLKTHNAFNIIARCNPCNMNFETLSTLEMHNAMNHNGGLPVQPSIPQPPVVSAEELEEDQRVRSRIIALFEDSSIDED